MAVPSRALSRIPPFASIKEAAEFWSTHDSGDFEDQFEPVEYQVAPDFRSVSVIELEFDRDTWNRLRSFAEGRKVKLDDLARAWVLDGYARAEADATTAASTAE